MKPISATCSSGAMPFTFAKARRTVRFPFPLMNGLHPFLTAPNRKHRMIAKDIQLQLQLQLQPQQQQQPQQIVVICPRRSSRPDNHSDRFPPRYFPNPPGSTPPGNRFAPPLSGQISRFHSPNRSVPLPCGRILSAPTGVVRLLRQSRRRVDIRVAPTGACAKPQSKLSPPPGSNFVVFSAAQCLY